MHLVRACDQSFFPKDSEAFDRFKGVLYTMIKGFLSVSLSTYLNLCIITIYLRSLLYLVVNCLIDLYLVIRLSVVVTSHTKPYEAYIQ